MVDMGLEVWLDVGHECRECRPLQEGTLENDLEEIVAPKTRVDDSSLSRTPTGTSSAIRPTPP